jgi:hypothetical protein
MRAGALIVLHMTVFCTAAMRCCTNLLCLARLSCGDQGSDGVKSMRFRQPHLGCGCPVEVSGRTVARCGLASPHDVFRAGKLEFRWHNTCRDCRMHHSVGHCAGTLQWRQGVGSATGRGTGLGRRGDAALALALLQLSGPVCSIDF